MTSHHRTHPVRCAVVGAGHYGRFHAEKYAAHPDAQLVAVVDQDPATARAVAERYGVPHFRDHRELPDGVDAVSVAVPAQAHYAVAHHLLSRGLHLLVEKPLTASASDGERLVALAERMERVLQAGHLERFSAPWRAMERRPPPAHIQARRLCPFPNRNADVDVVLDLMVHDLDLIHWLVGAPIRHIEAEGLAVVTERVDTAWARLHFENGTVADVTASRCAEAMDRRMQCHWTDNDWTCVDFQRLTLSTPDSLQHFEKADLLAREIDGFVRAVQGGGAPPVTGTEGLQAVATANRIQTAIAEQCREGHAQETARLRQHLGGA